MELHEYQLISLLKSFYKLLSNVLARQMEWIMGHIISPSQNAFVRGRQMLDCSLIANACIDYWTKAKKTGVVCQIDMEKAYNHVNWEFLLWVLLQMGFGKKWCFWIRIRISTAVAYAILVMGPLLGFPKGIGV